MADVRAVVDCSAYALCSDVRDLGWRAITRCRGCVTEAVDDSVRAVIDERHDANPVRVVTSDELERLLCQAHQLPVSGPTSSP